MTKPLALVVSSPGTNRDNDVAYALSLAGAEPVRVPLAVLGRRPQRLLDAQLVVLAGGFSHADALGAGALAGLELATSIGDELRAFAASGRPVLGICNGFQMLVRSGLLPGSLTRNASGQFVCKWVTLSAEDRAASVWTAGLEDPIDCPVAHGEGRYVADDETVGAHSALGYVDDTNPNGSVADTAGVADATGMILGLMPHPENHVLERQHPRFARGEHRNLARSLFDAGVAHVKARG
jgi:phosphoribosylformylglycinamidine synthase subunit PurQ / glutaminase